MPRAATAAAAAFGPFRDRGRDLFARHPGAADPTVIADGAAMTSEVIDRRSGRPEDELRSRRPDRFERTKSMTDFQQMATRYIDAWNETDPAARRRAVGDVFTADARYVDPLADVEGPTAIADLIGAVQAQFPGLTFALDGPVDGHHDQARFRWALGPAGGEAVVVGFDVVTVAAGGKVRSVHGFLDKVPAAA